MLRHVAILHFDIDEPRHLAADTCLRLALTERLGAEPKRPICVLDFSSFEIGDLERAIELMSLFPIA